MLQWDGAIHAVNTPVQRCFLQLAFPTLHFRCEDIQIVTCIRSRTVHLGAPSDTVSQKVQSRMLVNLLLKHSSMLFMYRLNDELQYGSHNLACADCCVMCRSSWICGQHV